MNHETSSNFYNDLNNNNSTKNCLINILSRNLSNNLMKIIHDQFDIPSQTGHNFEVIIDTYKPNLGSKQNNSESFIKANTQNSGNLITQKKINNIFSK